MAKKRSRNLSFSNLWVPFFGALAALGGQDRARTRQKEQKEKEQVNNENVAKPPYDRSKHGLVRSSRSGLGGQSQGQKVRSGMSCQVWTSSLKGTDGGIPDGGVGTCRGEPAPPPATPPLRLMGWMGGLGMGWRWAGGGLLFAYKPSPSPSPAHPQHSHPAPQVPPPPPMLCNSLVSGWCFLFEEKAAPPYGKVDWRPSFYSL